MTPEALVEFAEALARISASGGGAKAFAAALARASGGGVLIEDAQWRHLASAGEAPMPASGRAAAENGAAGGQAVAVRAGGEPIGWVSVFGVNGVAGADLPYLMRLTAAAVAADLARSASGEGGDRRRSFWERLVSGAFGDLLSARDDAHAHGIALAPAYLAVALELDVASEDAPPPERGELRAIALEAFRGGADGDVGLLERGAVLLALVPAVREVDASNARTAAVLLPKTLAKRKPHLRLSGGVGNPAPPLDLGRTASEAEAALAIGRRVFGAGRAVAYDDLGAYPLLYAGAAVADLRAFAVRVLAPLRAYDEKHQTELERTLRLYFAVGQNVKTAAAHLNVHRHTVFYRLRQIAEMCGYTLESPHDQLTLRLAVAIDALHS